MVAGDFLSLGTDGRVGRRHVAVVAAALRPRRAQGTVIGIVQGFALGDAAGVITGVVGAPRP
jgi:hypothetical protein